MKGDVKRLCDLTMVVPTYNERAQLDTLLQRLFHACAERGLNAEVVVVDDDSGDGTGALADAWARHAAVRVIHRPGKLGLGSAVIDGFAIAESDIVGVMDADLSHPPSLVPALYAMMATSDIDMVVASR